MAGKVAKGVAQAASETNNKINEIKYKFEDKSSSELKEIVKSDGLFGASTIEKKVAMKILRERGDD